MAVNRLQAAQKRIPTLVKNSALVEVKRRRIVEAAVGLFIRKGYHGTTTREIARAAGLSVGALYEYIQSKEDVLYLVCDAIHREIEDRLRGELNGAPGPEAALREAVRRYFEVCDRMQDPILLIYRETASLDPESAEYVLRNEERITGIFERLIEDGVQSGSFRLESKKALRIMADNIMVLGHMWAFRRWRLRDAFTLAEYTDYQIALIMNELKETAL